MFLPAVLRAVDRRIETQINFGYDVGRGFVVGEEECRKLLDHIVEHPGMRNNFKNGCDKRRLMVIKELGEKLYSSLTSSGQKQNTIYELLLRLFVKYLRFCKQSRRRKIKLRISKELTHTISRLVSLDIKSFYLLR